MDAEDYLNDRLENPGHNEEAYPRRQREFREGIGPAPYSWSNSVDIVGRRNWKDLVEGISQM